LQCFIGEVGHISIECAGWLSWVGSSLLCLIGATRLILIC
jgi:hypothetical protein